MPLKSSKRQTGISGRIAFRQLQPVLGYHFASTKRGGGIMNMDGRQASIRKRQRISIYPNLPTADRRRAGC